MKGKNDEAFFLKGRKFTLRSSCEDETITIGERVGMLLEPGNVIALIGELGAGKTTMVKGIVQGLGIQDRRQVKSPTFSLVYEYNGRMPIYHFDAYRLKDAAEMFQIGSDEMVFGHGVSIVEWADNVRECLPEEYLQITLTALSRTERSIEVCIRGKCYDKIAALAGDP
ncbi:MAG: tRNA (adenosine(37)-N6)-threonylcarbamoyltransferase complex ATPase subunit type 1 TsaE [Candidatus Brocadiaceae bacterium]|nr:tRNA (adenosine(37)-N6)-threonylcarbamoyltransferase complex ATPase subunit type 1 TsaE [Candidatus Brocadiaceae bacterium]